MEERCLILRQSVGEEMSRSKVVCGGKMSRSKVVCGGKMSHSKVVSW